MIIHFPVIKSKKNRQKTDSFFMFVGSLTVFMVHMTDFVSICSYFIAFLMAARSSSYSSYAGISG